jgi:hypothetical protein
MKLRNRPAAPGDTRQVMKNPESMQQRLTRREPGVLWRRRRYRVQLHVPIRQGLQGQQLGARAWFAINEDDAGERLPGA